MPAKSKKQQRFFALVRALKSGKLSPDQASRAVRQVARTISSADAKKFAATKHTNLPEVLSRIVASPRFVEGTLKEIVETGTPAYIKGTLVDTYTANLLLTVTENMTDENKISLLNRPISEAVVLSYKILTS